MNDYESLHIYMAIAIGVLVLSPFLMVIFPLSIANALYKTSMTWIVTIPGKTYLFYAVGLLLLFVSFFILFLLSLSKNAKIIAGVSLVLSVLFIAHGTQQFIGLSGEKISFKETAWEGEHHYTWDEVEKVIYRENRLSGKLAEFEFHFQDGNKMSLKENLLVEPWHKAIREKLSRHEKEFERK